MLGDIDALVSVQGFRPDFMPSSIAVSVELNMLAVACHNRHIVTVFSLPTSSSCARELSLLFSFNCKVMRACIAFTDTAPIMLLAGNTYTSGVYIWDPMSPPIRFGFLGGSMYSVSGGTYGLGAKGDQVAVSTWGSMYRDQCANKILVFQGSGMTWTLQYTICCDNLTCFTIDTKITVAVLDGQIYLFASVNGNVYRKIPCAGGVRALVQYGAGWVVLKDNCIQYIKENYGGVGRKCCKTDFVSETQTRTAKYVTVALVPECGFVVCRYGQLEWFTTPAKFAMDRMSSMRIGWMKAVYKAIYYTSVVGTPSSRLV